MSLEDEMRREIRRLEDELSMINKELDRLSERISQLVMMQQKKQRDLRILRSHFEPILDDKGEIQTSLARMARE
ncbi:MAG: hypothetical protein ABIG30_00375 [Candidatus Aenigmatarchaeota archaeon]